jgi:uncharacterized membrane protein (DUF106 family)
LSLDLSQDEYQLAINLEIANIVFSTLMTIAITAVSGFGALITLVIAISVGAYILTDWAYDNIIKKIFEG